MAETIIHHQELHPVLQKAHGFWSNYSRPIIYISSAIIILIVGWFVYKYSYKIPEEQKANDAVFTVQKYFSDFSNAPSDSVKASLAQRCLNGEGTSLGTLKFISKYGNTAAGNLCNYYTGACYLNLKQFDKAIKYLKDFNTSSSQVQSHAYGMIGDAYSELKKNDDAFDYYKKAAEVNKKDEYTCPEFLFKAGLFAQSIGKNKDAVSMFKKIRDEYPLSEKGKNIDRYLARLGEIVE